MRSRRMLVALGIGILSALAYLLYSAQFPPRPGIDFFWSLRAARDLLADADPYRYAASRFMIPYPLPSAILALPFAPLPDRVAGAIFIGGSSALLAWALTGDRGWWRLLIFTSAPYWVALASTQWSPMLLAASYLPLLLPVILCKPTLGLAVLFNRKPAWRAIGCCVAIGGLSLLIDPRWPWRWLAQTRGYAGFIPLLTPLGVLLLLALLRWRDPRARWVLILACLPQQRVAYDQLLLWRVASSRQQMLVLSALSWIGYFATIRLANENAATWITVTTLYLPALAMVLWPRRDRSTDTPAVPLLRAAAPDQ